MCCQSKPGVFDESNDVLRHTLAGYHREAIHGPVCRSRSCQRCSTRKTTPVHGFKGSSRSLDIRLPNSGTRFVRHTFSRPFAVRQLPKKTETAEWCLPGDWCLRFGKNATRVAGPLEISALRASMKTFLFIPIMWTHLLENLAARLRAVHIIFQKSTVPPPMEVLQDRISDHHK